MTALPTFDDTDVARDAYLALGYVPAHALRIRALGDMNRPIRDEYLIVQGGTLAGVGAHSYSKGNATGGSDVGLSETVAREEEGQWRLYGRKWFTSAIASQMALTLARPAGNPPGADGRSATAYLWERVWEKDAWLTIIGRLMIVETKEEWDVATGTSVRRTTVDCRLSCDDGSVIEGPAVRPLKG